MNCIAQYRFWLNKPVSLLSALVAIVIFSFCIQSSAMASPVDYNGIVSVSTTMAAPGAQAVVAVNLSNNDVDLAALTIPLQYDNSVLSVDSISFVGSLLPPGITGNFFVDEAAGIVKINYLPQIPPAGSTLSSPSGLLANIYFKVSLTALHGIYAVDSVNQEYVNINFADLTGQIFLIPAFEPGAVEVQISTAVNENTLSGLPSEFSLSQNYPNPFNPSTVIEFALPKASMVHLEVFNVLGQSVAKPLNSRKPAGFHSIEFDASELPSGIYFYRLSYDLGSETMKMILLK